MIDTLWHLIGQYGYLAVAVGCFVEGEIAILLGVLAFYKGYIGLEGVWIAATVGTLLGDFTWFYLGHLMGRPALARRPKWQDRVVHIEKLFYRYGAITMIVYHALYALRSLTPFVLGAIGVSTWRFIFYDLIGTLIWSTVVVAIAYFLADAITRVLDHIHNLEQGLLAIAVLAALVGWLVYYLRKRRARKE